MRQHFLHVEPLEDRRLLAVRFAVIGDWGSSSINADYVANMVKHEDWGVDLILTTGDNNYGQLDLGHSNWDSLVGARYGAFIQRRLDGKYQLQTSDVQRFFPTVGNHDSSADGTGQTGLSGGIIPGYIDYFVTNPGGDDRLGPGNGRHLNTESYYDFRWGPLHFFAVDSDHARVDAVSMAAQQSWLQTTMAASDATWKFVYFHHPPYSSGGVHGDNPEMQWDFAAWGADAVFGGHDHIYERIVGPQDGLPYFISGLGGRSIYPLGIPTAGSQFRYNASYGAMRVTVDGDAATFEFLSIDDGLHGQNGGALIDTFTLTQGTVDPPTAPPVVLEVIRNDGGWQPTELNSLAFVFSKDVTASLGQNDFSITNARNNAAILLGANSLNPTEARWDLSIVPLAAGFYRVNLDAQGISDAQGNLLDGNGDGVPGDAWEGLFLVALPGDANLDGAVDGSDYGLWKAAAAAAWEHGDFNQDGVVDETDYAFWESNKFTDLRIPRPLSDRVPRAAISTVTITAGTTVSRELSFHAGLSVFHVEISRVETSRQVPADASRLETAHSSALAARRESWIVWHGKLATDPLPIGVDRIFADELAEIMPADEVSLSGFFDHAHRHRASTRSSPSSNEM